jgi:penicillin-binding protein 1A
MMVLLQAVVHQGTGAQAEVVLNHPLGGKTGTTNDFTDAWFVGFSPSVTCGTWIGFDTRESLGKGEQGAKAALPMWIDFMKAAIAGKDDEAFPTAGAPKKVLQVAVTPDSADDASKAAGLGDQPQDPEAPDSSGTPNTPDPATAPHPSAPIVREPPPAETPSSNPSFAPTVPPRPGVVVPQP